MPAMYLKKLGHERRNSRTGRRKSRMFSTNELRNPIEEEDEVVQEIPAEEALDDTAKEVSSVTSKYRHKLVNRVFAIITIKCKF